MPGFKHLPESLLLFIVQEWLNLKEIVRLDSAATSPACHRLVRSVLPEYSWTDWKLLGLSDSFKSLRVKKYVSEQASPVFVLEGVLEQAWRWLVLRKVQLHCPPVYLPLNKQTLQSSLDFCHQVNAQCGPVCGLAWPAVDCDEVQQKLADFCEEDEEGLLLCKKVNNRSLLILSSLNKTLRSFICLDWTIYHAASRPVLDTFFSSPLLGEALHTLAIFEIGSDTMMTTLSTQCPNLQRLMLVQFSERCKFWLFPLLEVFELYRLADIQTKSHAIFAEIPWENIPHLQRLEMNDKIFILSLSSIFTCCPNLEYVLTKSCTYEKVIEPYSMKQVTKIDWKTLAYYDYPYNVPGLKIKHMLEFISKVPLISSLQLFKTLPYKQEGQQIFQALVERGHLVNVTELDYCLNVRDPGLVEDFKEILQLAINLESLKLFLDVESPSDSLTLPRKTPTFFREILMPIFTSDEFICLKQLHSLQIIHSYIGDCIQADDFVQVIQSLPALRCLSIPRGVTMNGTGESPEDTILFHLRDRVWEYLDIDYTRIRAPTVASLIEKCGLQVAKLELMYGRDSLVLGHGKVPLSAEHLNELGARTKK